MIAYEPQMDKSDLYRRGHMLSLYRVIYFICL